MPVSEAPQAPTRTETALAALNSKMSRRDSDGTEALVIVDSLSHYSTRRCWFRSQKIADFAVEIPTELRAAQHTQSASDLKQRFSDSVALHFCTRYSDRVSNSHPANFYARRKEARLCGALVSSQERQRVEV